MTKPRVGVLALDEDGDIVAALQDRCAVVPVAPTSEAIAAATGLEAWCVDVQALPPPVLLAVRDAAVPGLFLVDPADRRSWHRVLRKGHHDVVWTPAAPDEVRARMLGMLARRASWTTVAGALCRELAHDLRGPLQAMNFTVAALQQDGAVPAEYAEDIDALLAATDVADLMLDGISNLGRHAVPATEDQAPVDLAGVVREVVQRRGFGGAVALEGAEAMAVRVRRDVLLSAIEDVVRVAWVRAANGRRVQVQCLRFGADAVLTTRSRAYDALLDHLPALLWRDRPIMLRRDRVPMPLAGLAYAREVAHAAGGDITVRREGQEMCIEVRLPLSSG